MHKKFSYIFFLIYYIAIIDSGVLTKNHGYITSDELKEEYEKELNMCIGIASISIAISCILTWLNANIIGLPLYSGCF